MPELVDQRVQFQNMSWTPDVPSNVLSENEYSIGLNVETDVRSINKVLGEQEVLAQIPGTPVYLTGGNRTNINFVFLVATREGRWFKVDLSGVSNITPGVGANPNVALNGYSDSVNITDSEVGGVFFLNDGLRPPMFFRPTDNEIQIYDTAPGFIWNYEAGLGVSRVTASFVRAYASPHGNVLVAGNLIKYLTTGITQVLQATLRWSDLFANGSAPLTWNVSLTTFSNEVDLPVRGPLIDGYHFNGNFYVASYWDTCSLFPIAYQSTTQPVFSIKLINSGRGLLSNNSWTNTDQIVYGFDARDIWQFDGQTFTSIGNQRVKNYFYNSLSPPYGDRSFVVNNTNRYQIEIYYPDVNTTTGWCNKMIAYRYDLNVWQPPRDVANACLAVEGPLIQNNDFITTDRRVFYARGGDSATNNSKLIQKDLFGVNSFVAPIGGATIPINALFEKRNIIFPDIGYTGKLQFDRIYPELIGTGSVNLNIGGVQNVSQTPFYGNNLAMSLTTNTPYVQAGQTTVRALAFKVSSNDVTDTWSLSALTIYSGQVERDK